MDAMIAYSTSMLQAVAVFLALSPLSISLVLSASPLW